MKREHYGDRQGLLLLSRNAVFNFVISNRNFGKTWAFKKRAFKRALKKGKKTIWLRMFRNEAKECARKMFSSADLCAYCGISPYDKKTNPNGNFKQEGSVFYCRKSPKAPWVWFLQVFALSDSLAIRSADDCKIDTIVFDEFSKTPERLRRYVGQPVTDFIDIFFSLKREHEVRAVFLGNKEGVTNPFFSYFGIRALPSEWEGIRTFRDGSIAVQQINNKSEPSNVYDRKVSALLSGTKYGAYIEEGEYKTAKAFKKAKTPPNSNVWLRVDINGHPLTISTYNGLYYVRRGIDATQAVYMFSYLGKYRKEFLLVNRLKPLCRDLVCAVSDNRVRYDSPESVEALAPFLQWLGIKA